MRVIYLDMAFFLNAGMDYLILRCMTSLGGLPVRNRRLLAAAGFGGSYGVLSMAFGSTSATMVMLFVAAVMVYLAFGWDRWFPRRYLLFWIVSCAIGGLCAVLERLWYSVRSPWVIFGASAALSLAMLSVVFRGSAGGRGGLVRAEFCHEGRKLRVTLLRDSGNTLRDPHTGQILCILWSEALQPLLVDRETLFLTVPFSSLGREQGELHYFYCDSITVDGMTYYRYPVGLMDHSPSDGRGFVGLWGGEEKGEQNIAKT